MFSLFVIHIRWYDIIMPYALWLFPYLLKIMERGITFPTWLVVFGQSQCTVSDGQSKQTVLVRRRDFEENEAERGGA